MRVCVIGTGYVGLVTGVCLAHVGHNVVCVDHNVAKVKQLQTGRSPIYEPGLETIMRSAMTLGHLSFTTDLAAGVAHGDILFIAVGTPPLPTGGNDLRGLEAVARSIGQQLDGRYRLIVNKSTVPIGSGNWIHSLISEASLARDAATTPNVEVLSNPEFFRKGSAVYDTLNPARIVLGGGSKRALTLMKDLYTPIISLKFSGRKAPALVPLEITDLASTEMLNALCS